MIPPVPAGILLANGLLYSLGVAGIVLIKQTLERAHKAETERERLAGTVERLTGAGEDFLSYARSAEYRSAKDERNRLTREVHDVVGYTLTNIRMMMEASLRRKDMDREELERLFSWTLDQAQRGLQEIRFILQLIRSGGTAETRGIAALAEAGTVFQAATGTRVAFDWGNMTDRWNDGDRDLLALRLVQEGMINAVRHGMARKVEISLFQDDVAVFITVQDDGSGMDAVKKGIGLSGMEERVKAIGGSLVFSPVRPGFRISAVLPFQTKPEVSH
jgi:signal transduction histidine kinase